ncbi:MAG TPA: 5-methyltetrahydropteroyltriglutamate--homocysteine S-methyltransferase, partial [Terrimicrobiaceae bacterium]|nr:5-methyltetrahydropteroyltriglutamate--homocysteine S-methyltransferase [Terrimicrobiaceae bacterium]
SEMTKWFDTNYHYIVPEFHEETKFQLSGSKPFDEFKEALALGIRTKPVLIGPLTYLYLGKSSSSEFERLALLDRLLPVYADILHQLNTLGAEWVQIDEPILAFELTSDWQTAFLQAYRTLRSALPDTKLLLATYFGELRENIPLAVSLPVDALHLDVTRAGSELDQLVNRLPSAMALSLGVVDGRNVWRNNFELSLDQINKAKRVLSANRILIAPSCSLLHSPVTLRHESAFDAEIKEWLAFAEEKLKEVTQLARLAEGGGDAMVAYRNRVASHSRRASERIHRTEVKARSQAVKPEDSRRKAPYRDRRHQQRAALGLPLLPTTTIGSFPQTADIRSARARWKRGELADDEYEKFLREKTAECIRLQEDVGLDVLVHGEFERNDMVEYFGEQLDGFAFTENGWVQSYGSRCVKPPIIYGDVRRPHAMTVEWSRYAQSRTSKPMKGMLTGPITILQWSFVRDDQPRSETARQIALAIRDEVLDLEAAGIKVIQIDEPALREGLPLRGSDWQAYLQWAIESFRLASSGVRDETQIHTHMCYCEFNDIIDSIAALDADVISMEASRSNMELLDAFAAFRYPNEVGPGVWDIHSPRVPGTAEMENLLRTAAAVLPIENLWVNPDCGLKTRGWDEVIASLRNMTKVAEALRKDRSVLSGVSAQPEAKS